MKMTLCVLGAVLALSVAAPASAQDRMKVDSWAPWDGNYTIEAPAPPVRSFRQPTLTKVVAEAPQSDAIARRLLQIDRFWVIGTFR